MPRIEVEILLHTDQTQCYDEHGNEIDCPDSGQDGAVAAEKEAGRDRFSLAGGTVKDRRTGLVWAQNAGLADFPLTWEESFEFVREMNRKQFSGRSDWKLPGRDDLFSLLSHQHVNPSLPEHHPFLNTFNGYYWTSTQCARLPDQAWYVHMGGARIYRGMKHGSYMAWPVAGSQSGGTVAEARFTASGHVFYDRLTRRTWLDDTRPGDGPLSWQQALDRIKVINEDVVENSRHWRLPNIRELESLVDLTAHSPALAPGCPVRRPEEGYWSATTSLYEPGYAWVLYTRDGAIGVGFKPQKDFYLLAVR